MIYRVTLTVILLLLAGVAFLKAPGRNLDEATQSVQQPQPTQAPTPAQKSEDDALKGFKLN